MQLMNLFEIFILAALTTYRITAMIHSESGPADIFGRFRSWIGVRYDQYSNPRGTNWVAEGVLCFYCLSVWIGILITLFLAIMMLAELMSLAIMVLFPFALSGVAVYLKKAVG
jgi:type IV secretory pathway TrbL component